jgi:tRNA (cmo5U34)-methyltransferase
MSEIKGWQSKETAQNYRRIANFIIPSRKEILSTIAQLATAFVPEQPRIMDLGCGYGDVTAEILKFKPHASICMVDFSDEMLRLAGERFDGDTNVKIIKHDLNNGIPVSVMSEPFDVVVSCLALHHLEFGNRIKLYSGIAKVLREGSVFINGDRFKGDSPIINEWEFNNWINWVVLQKQDLAMGTTFDEVKQTLIESEKKQGDKPGTIWDMANDLKHSGFKHIDCVWKYQNLAVIVGAK